MLLALSLVFTALISSVAGSGLVGNQTEFLEDGVSVVGSVEHTGFEYFKFRNKRGDDAVQFDLTMFSGDGDIYVSTEYSKPNATVAAWSASRWGDDTLVIDEDNDGYCTACTYYIGIYGYAAEKTTFSLTASSLGTAIELEAGIPQSGRILVDEVAYYTFDVTEANDVDISVQVSDGIGGVYISTESQPDPDDSSSYSWHASWSGHLEVDAKPGDDGWCTNCTYYISVAQYFSYNLTYTITAATDYEAVTLQPGESRQDSVVENKYKYYTITVYQLQDLQFSVTALTGDPDLYISTSVEHPTKGDHQWSAAAYGSDHVTIHSGEDEFCNGNDADNGCTFYIGVFGYHDASYTILVTRVIDAIQLVPGVPQTDSLASGEERVFKLGITSANRVTFTVTPTFNDASIWVSTTGVPDPEDSDSYQWSELRADPLMITAHSTDDGFLSSGTYYALVQGQDGGAVNYTILGTGSNDTTTLVRGQVQYDSVQAHHYSYFRYNADLESDVTVTVTCTNGDPDIVVSQATRWPVLGGNDTWSARTYGGDELTIPAADLDLDEPIYIGVYGYTSRSTLSFTVVVTQSDDDDSGDETDVITLLNGVPQAGRVTNHATKLYKLNVGTYEEDERITVTVSPSASSGHFGVYMSTSVANGYPNPNNASSFVWSSTHGNPLSVTAHPHNPTYCTSCTYYIAVALLSDDAGEDASESFTVTGSISGDVITLREGVPQFDSVSADSYAYYAISFDHAADIVIDVTPFFGDPDLAVSTNSSRPTLDNAEWTSAWVGHDSLVIKQTDDGFTADGTYYIGVYGYATWDSDAAHGEVISYTVTASLSDGVVTLNDGQPQTGTVTAGNVRWYKLVVAEDVDAITFTVSPSMGDADLYVLAADEDEDDYPTPGDYSSYDWRVTEGNPSVTLTISSDFNKFCAGCEYHIGVAAQAAAANETDASSTYTITATTSDSITTLQSGQPVQGSVAAGDYANFGIFVDNKGSLDVTLTTSNGFVAVYLSSTQTHPTEDEDGHTWSIPVAQTAGETQAISIEIPEDPEASGVCYECTYYISVYAPEDANADVTGGVGFTLTATANGESGDSATDLLPAQSFEYQASGGSGETNTAYFTYTPRRDGDVMIFFSAASSVKVTATAVDEEDGATRSAEAKEGKLVFLSTDEDICHNLIGVSCVYELSIEGGNAGEWIAVMVTESLGSYGMKLGSPVHGIAPSRTDDWDDSNRLVYLTDAFRWSLTEPIVFAIEQFGEDSSAKFAVTSSPTDDPTQSAHKVTISNDQTSDIISITADDKKELCDTDEELCVLYVQVTGAGDADTNAFVLTHLVGEGHPATIHPGDTGATVFVNKKTEGMLLYNILPGTTALSFVATVAVPGGADSSGKLSFSYAEALAGTDIYDDDQWSFSDPFEFSYSETETSTDLPLEIEPEGGYTLVIVVKDASNHDSGGVFVTVSSNEDITPSASPDPAPEDKDKKKKGGSKAGIIVGVIFGVICVFAGAGYFVWKKKQADSSPLPESGYGQLGP